MFRLTHLAPAAALIAALGAPSSALAAWTAPTTLATSEGANPAAQGAFGGSVITGWLDPSASLFKRTADGFSSPTTLNAADPYEKVWAAALDSNGGAVVLTVRRHKPLQRIRATFVAADGKRGPTRTISDNTHSAAQPTLSVAPDGTAVAGWVWHDPAGWRAQVAIRRPGQATFDRPQTISPPAPRLGKLQPRPFVRVAAGDGGRGVATWQVGGNAALPESPLHVRTAGTDGVFGADQELPDAGGYADVGLAMNAQGEAQVAYLDEHFSGHEGPASLHVTQGPAGAPLPAPQVLSKGGKGTSSGGQVAAAYSADGTATVAWAKPGDEYEQGGTLEVFTRAPGAGFGPAQTLATGALGVALAGGPGDSAVLAWMQETSGHTVHAALRPQAGGPFGAGETISGDAKHALWPSVAMTPAGDAVAAWVTNTSGGGSGHPTAAIAPAGN
ncbi:MAG TPA: hypothetical protein VNS09_19920 [Solirubrobacter sp.]|nr:hypothetical protein [Solirubrobacter sp.]